MGSCIMFLQGLTDVDRKLLDIMWHIDTQEELNQFLSMLPKVLRDRAEVLIELVKLAAIDDEIEAMETYPDAEDMLRDIMD